MKILITGVCGNIGSFLYDELKDKHEVIGLDMAKSSDKCQQYYTCDITDKSQIEDVLKVNNDLDIIIHCAALAHKKGNDLSRDRFMKVNYEATKYFVNLSNEYLNLKNFIFISTISVYGERLDKDVYVETDNCQPKSPYAVAKRLSEEYIIANCKSNYTMLRFAPVYSKNFTLNIDVRSMIKGIPYRVGNGKQKLSLCNIKNIYEAINYIIDNAKNEKNEIYNISDSEVYDYNDLLNFIGASKKIILPKFGFKILHRLNSITLKKQFIHENSIKLISDNIYSSDKLNNKVSMKHKMKDVI